LEELRQTSPTAGATSVENKGATTIVSILRQRAAEKGQAPLFTLLKDGEKIDRTLSFEQLDGRARSIAARLQALSLGGERALLLFPPGLEFIEALFGCLYAKVPAVPVSFPADPQGLARAQAIAADAGARCLLATSETLELLKGALPPESLDLRMALVATDGIDASVAQGWQEPGVGSDDIAFLQYTSGSTGAPNPAEPEPTRGAGAPDPRLQAPGQAVRGPGFSWSPGSGAWSLCHPAQDFAPKGLRASSSRTAT
jgi:acyl-CoA synthetase (AMP-forming)/AMP-acid ligase II